MMGSPFHFLQRTQVLNQSLKVVQNLRLPTRSIRNTIRCNRRRRNSCCSISCSISFASHANILKSCKILPASQVLQNHHNDLLQWVFSFFLGFGWWMERIHAEERNLNSQNEHDLLQELSELYDQKLFLNKQKQLLDLEISRVKIQQQRLEAQLRQLRSKNAGGIVRGHMSPEPVQYVTLNAKQYKITKQIGSGALGIVRCGIHEASQSEVAFKRCPYDDSGISDLENEIRILKHIAEIGGHENLIRLEGVAVDDTYVFLATEMMRGGELFQHIISDGPVPERQVKDYIRQLAKGIDFLHSNGIVHGDIKPENILLDETKSVLKLADFGCATIQGQPTVDQHIEARTTAYCPPELLLGSHQSCESDMWALGCILYVMLLGRHPFDKSGRSTRGQIEANIVTGNIAFDSHLFKKISAEARDIIGRLMERDPNDRLTAKQLLNHPWLVVE